MLADYARALAWVESWRTAQGANVEVAWESRRWGSVGEQTVPARVLVSGAAAIAAVARVAGTWALWRDRAAALQAELGGSARDDVATAGVAAAGVAAAMDPDDVLASSIATHLNAIGALDTTDFQRLIGVCRWLRLHPASGRYVRELPIRGIDSKWLERRRSMVEALVGGDGLGLRQPPSLVRLRFLDAELSPAGLGDITAPLAEVSGLDLRPHTVLIVENLQTFLALPPLPGTIAIDGHGDLAPQLADVAWVPLARRLYWGDLDSHGMRILSQTRAAGLDLESCLMDVDTLLAFRDLWVAEPTPFRGTLQHLTAAEQATLELLRNEGNVRLEQERIAWNFALGQLTAFLGP